MFCTDFSASADEAFGYARGIARASGGRIVGMHGVTSTCEDPEYVSFVTPELRMQIDDGIRGRVERELQERDTSQCPAGAPGETWVVKGNPAAKIFDVATRANIDLTGHLDGTDPCSGRLVVVVLVKLAIRVFRGADESTLHGSSREGIPASR